MRSHEIRSRFVDHFASRGHVRLPSGSLVPPDWDTSVLITTAGMQPLKRYFLGAEAPPAPRATTVQKCFRTVDIDEVGNTARHLTFFEMMGNFSFGDYFKRAAIDLAWELVTSPTGFALRPRQDLDHRLRGRRARPRRRGGGRAVAGDRHARRADRPAGRR